MNLTPTKAIVIFVVGGCGGIGEAVVKAALAFSLKVAVFDLKKSII